VSGHNIPLVFVQFFDWSFSKPN